MAPDTFVIVTAYNEADRIGATLDALAEAFPGAALLLADDGSADRTSEIASARGARVLRSERMIGKGGAATLAARAALADARTVAPDGPSSPAAAEADAAPDRREPIFILCDGDLGESAVQLRALEQALRRDEADIAVAAFARRVGGGVGLALGFSRWAIRRRCGLQATAPISGQRALRARVLDDVLPFAHGFGMEVGMTIDAVRAGHRLLELELSLDHRASGRTLAGFAHRARQLADFVRVYVARGRLAPR
jgi:glycosyltransferase involved in cell wall biosynthesis